MASPQELYNLLFTEEHLQRQEDYRRQERMKIDKRLEKARNERRAKSVEVVRSNILNLPSDYILKRRWYARIFGYKKKYGLTLEQAQALEEAREREGERTVNKAFLQRHGGP